MALKLANEPEITIKTEGGSDVLAISAPQLLNRETSDNFNDQAGEWLSKRSAKAEKDGEAGNAQVTILTSKSSVEIAIPSGQRIGSAVSVPVASFLISWLNTHSEQQPAEPDKSDKKPEKSPKKPEKSEKKPEEPDKKPTPSEEFEGFEDWEKKLLESIK